MSSATRAEALRAAKGFDRNAHALREHLARNKEYFDQHPEEKARLEADIAADELRARQWRGQTTKGA